MLRGYLIVGAALLIYLAGSQFAPLLAVGAALLGTLAWPGCCARRCASGSARPLARAALRLRRHGRRGLPGLPAADRAAGHGAGAEPDPGAGRPGRGRAGRPPVWLIGLFLTAMLSLYACGPWILLRLMRYRLDHCTFAGEQSRLEGVRVRDLWKLGAKSMLLMIAAGLGIGLLSMALRWCCRRRCSCSGRWPIWRWSR